MQKTTNPGATPWSKTNTSVLFDAVKLYQGKDSLSMNQTADLNNIVHELGKRGHLIK